MNGAVARGCPRAGLRLCAALGMLGGATPSSAAPAPAPAASPEAVAAPMDESTELPRSTVAIAVLGTVAGSFLTEPRNQGISLGGLHARPAGLPDEPGFAGIGGGLGIAVEARWRGVVGIEWQVLRTVDRGTADYSVVQAGRSYQFSFELEQGAVHLPLLIKGVLPSEWVRPSLFVGPEFVIPDTVSYGIVDGNAPYDVDLVGDPRPYTMLAFGLGAELLLPIPDVDLRVPLALRGGYTPGLSTDRSDRARYVGPGPQQVERIEHSGAFELQAAVTLGMAFHL